MWEDFVREEDRWIIYIALIIVLVIVLDEWAYRVWKVRNPGHLYSHLNDKTAPLVDASAPPTSEY